MPSHKTKRITEDIHRELTVIFRELKSPRIQGLVNTMRVDMTNDLSYCMVYVSAMEGLNEVKMAVEGLKSAGGYICRELGLRLKPRHVPVFLFHTTDFIEHGANISRLLPDWKNGEKENGGEHDD